MTLRIEALGHASFIVRTDQATVLFDPLLFGLHHEGLYDLYPPRTLDIGQLPPIDALVVSHGHPDHLDPDSLAAFPRHLPIFAVDDPLVIGSLQGLGFEQILVVETFVPIQIGDLTIVPTPAASGAHEHGFVLHDETTTVWHMVDTVPEPQGIASVLQRYPSIDALIAPWQPLLDVALSAGDAIAFPDEAYGRLLANIAQIEPKVLVLGACGFRAVGSASFTNHLIFPVTRARFLHDIAEVVPALARATLVLESGDAWTVDAGTEAVERGRLLYCRCDRDAYDWQTLAFRPFELGFPVQERRGHGFTRAECHAAIDLFFTKTLVEAIAAQQRFFSWHHKWQVIRQYEIAFHGHERSFWTFDFRSDAVIVTNEPCPLACAHTLMSASLLIGLVAGTISWDYAVLSAELRRYDRTYLAHPSGLRRPPPGLLFDPLIAVLATRDATEYFMARQIERVLVDWNAAEPKSLDTSTIVADVFANVGEHREPRPESWGRPWEGTI